jgi:hypothetical protein
MVTSSASHISTKKKSSGVPISKSSFSTKQPFAMLDPNEHGQRIAQRFKAIQYGKNTVGYQEYIKQVPKVSRKPRSSQHPSTPDHTRDIPTKRWQGLAKAWRKALHQYDPPDYVDSSRQNENSDIQTAVTSTMEQELQEAKAKGLLVDFGASETEAVVTSTRSDQLLDQWEAQRTLIDEEELDDLDSDDDLL